MLRWLGGQFVFPKKGVVLDLLALEMELIGIGSNLEASMAPFAKVGFLWVAWIKFIIGWKLLNDS